MLRVWFTDGMSESWLSPFSRVDWIPESTPAYAGPLTKGHIPKIYLDPFMHQFNVSKRTLHKVGVAEQRITVHRIIERCRKTGWQPPRYPEGILKRAMIDVLSEPTQRYCAGREFIWKPSKVGRELVESMPFYGHETVVKNKYLQFAGNWIRVVYSLADAWKYPRAMMMLLDALIVINRDLTPRNVMDVAGQHMNALHIGPHQAAIGFYRAVFQALPFKHIHDFHPSVGYKAIAAISSGLRYSCERTTKLFQHAGDFHRITGEPLSDYEANAVLWSDFGFTAQPLHKILDALHSIGRFNGVLLVPSHYRDDVIRERRPKSIVPIHMPFREQQFLFVYDSKIRGRS